MFCAHPWLQNQFTSVADATACSVKLRRLFEILEEIVLSGGKALVFTSYQAAVDLIVTEVARRFQIPTDFIDGRVPVCDRQPKVDAFAKWEGPALLALNPKAAGTGLNITAANHVIHYNLEWNPAVEDQASARAHRRGQTRPVTVHRLFYVNTVEDVISERMIRKRELAKAAVVGTDGSEHDVDDLIRAIRVSPVSAKSGA
jgi:SNF2 family DNA or RNA helicase